MNAVYFRSESEAIDAITMMLSNYNIRFDTEVRSRYSPLYYDIFLPDGLGYVKRQVDQKTIDFGLEGATAIEIKGRILFDTLSRYEMLYQQLCLKHEIRNFILLYAIGIIPVSVKDRIRKQYKNKFQIYSLQEFWDKLSGNRLSTIPNRTTYDWLIDRYKSLEMAKTSLTEERFTLFLGAGVSMSANLPSWWNLLKDMIDTCKQKEFKDGDIEKLTKVCYNSSIVMGRFVRMMMEKKSNDEDYYQCLHDALYGGISAYRSPLIDEICNLVDSKKLQAQSIITYNFDDVMERALRERGIGNYSVFGQNQPQRFFPIYHVHGFIPYANKDDIKSVPVLSEEEYHRVYASSYNWSNVEQLHALSRTTCIFIGLSMTDPNLRRLLDIAIQDSENDPRHFVFLPRISEFGTDKNAEAKNNEAMKIQKQIFMELGLRVIWYRDYNELPKLLKEIY